MKHKWKIKPRGKLTKYYVCKRCNMTVVASSKKLANELEPKCEGKVNNRNEFELDDDKLATRVTLPNGKIIEFFSFGTDVIMFEILDAKKRIFRKTRFPFKEGGY